MQTFHTYILASESRTLYVGMTNDLDRRLVEHRTQNSRGSFTCKYNVNRLVWFEAFDTAQEAIEAEKRIKGWRRSRKIELIEASNPQWQDLWRR
jgi:putative endonuclease